MGTRVRPPYSAGLQPLRKSFSEILRQFQSMRLSIQSPIRAVSIFPVTVLNLIPPGTAEASAPIVMMTRRAVYLSSLIA